MASVKVGFLFGAGVSLSSGAPTTGQLTDIVLQGEDVHRHSSGVYFLSKGSFRHLADQEGLERIRCFLGFLKSHADDFFGSKKNGLRVANYEDLYYLVSQLADAVDEYENPALSDFLRVVHSSFMSSPFLAFLAFDRTPCWTRTRHYIKGIISDVLSVLQPAENHFQPVVQAASDRFVSKLEIFTLNHDLLIENTLQKARISFSMPALGFPITSFARICEIRKVERRSV